MDLCLRFQTSHLAKGATCGEETTDLWTIVSKDLIGHRHIVVRKLLVYGLLSARTSSD